ncbi:MAG: cupin domain-containing protein [Planctomycetes bacterium]|nr:cupin domain-containing protein [Planctomycetota bacterium]
MTTNTKGMAGALALAALTACGSTNATRDDLPIRTSQLVAVHELEWRPLPGIAGAEQARLVGDPFQGSHRAYFRYPVGLASPLHAHTHGDRGVVVSGTLSLAVDGAPAKRLGPGSFFSIPAGVPHVTRVEGSEPCVFFMEREGPFDVVLVEAATTARAR